MKIASFREDLKRSHEASDLPLWEELYRQFFPGFEGMTDLRQDGPHQRQGIDRIVHVNAGISLKSYKVDEKIRDFSKQEWKLKKFSWDVALEYYSSVEGNTPGWVNKPLDCDFIAYAIKPLGEAALFPVPQLQKAWLQNSKHWIKQYGFINARNAGYTTRCCCVPLQELFGAIGSCFRATFSANPSIRNNLPDTSDHLAKPKTMLFQPSIANGNGNGKRRKSKTHPGQLDLLAANFQPELPLEMQ